MYAISLRYGEKYKDAYVVFKDVLRKEPDNRVALFNSAIIELEFVDKPEMAIDKFARVKALDQRAPSSEVNARLDEFIDKAMSLKMLKENK